MQINCFGGVFLDNYTKSFLLALGGLCAYICSLNWQLIVIWFLLMLVDVVTGNMKHIAKSDWSSKDMKLGLIKKQPSFFFFLL